MNPKYHRLSIQSLANPLNISVVFALLFLWFFLSYPIFYDDALISMRISKNFISGNGLFHNLEERVQTNTSLLFPILVSPIHLLSIPSALKATIIFDIIVSCINVLIIIEIIKSLSNFDSLKTGQKALIVFILNFGFYTGRLIAPGMETQVYLLLILASYWQFITGRNGYWLGFGTSFIRPEGGLMATIIVFLRYLQNIKISAHIKPLFIAIILAIIYLSVQYYVYGNWVPHTILVKWNIVAHVYEGLYYFFFRVLIYYRNIFHSVAYGMGIWFLIENYKRFEIKIQGVFLIAYSFIFNVLTGGNVFFEWYQTPVKAFLLMAACLFLIEKLKNGKPVNWVLVSAILVLASGYRFWNESTRFNQNGMILSAKMLHQLTENEKYYITSEPIGWFGYYNMHLEFRDYPGLASRHSLALLKKFGPVHRKAYFNNKVFEKIINEAGGQLILLSPPENESYSGLMKKEFAFICRIGRFSTTEFNSEFFVYANPKTLDGKKISELRRRATAFQFNQNEN